MVIQARDRRKLGCQGGRRVGGVSRLTSFLKTWLESRRGKGVGGNPNGCTPPLTIPPGPPLTGLRDWKH